jgi:uncharacterized membrane protein
MSTESPRTQPPEPTPESGSPHVAHLRARWPRYRHDHPPVLNVNELIEKELTLGARVADRVATTMGSWPFLIIQSGVLVLWVILNVVGWRRHWDPYPFILLNLGLSMQAAYAAPIIMMSQNRQAEKDRIMAQQDYEINTKAEEEIKVLMDHLETQHEMMIQILEHLRAAQVETKRLVESLEQRGAGAPGGGSVAS